MDRRPQRPTTLSLMSKRCPKALDYYEAGADYDRSVFAVGTAAHDILYEIGMASGSTHNVQGVCELLISEGRGGLDAEGPLPPDAAFEGRDLAVRWAKEQDWPDRAKTPHVFYELGIGLSEQWQPVGYLDDAAMLRVRIDKVQLLEEHDEDDVWRVLLVSDYKSAWPTDESELETLQRKAQAVAVAGWWESTGGPPVHAIRLEVVNLRTHATYSRDVWMDRPEVLKAWRNDLEALIRAANHMPRAARPGAGCLACPYWMHCSDTHKGADDRTLATAYALSEAVRGDFAAMLRDEVKDKSALPVEGGCVGYVAKPQATVNPDAARTLLTTYSKGRMSAADFELAATALEAAISVSGVKRLAKACYPGRHETALRKELIDQCLGSKLVARFGVHRD